MADDGRTVCDIQHTGTNLDCCAEAVLIFCFNSRAIHNIDSGITVQRNADVSRTVDFPANIQNGIALDNVAHDPNAAVYGTIDIHGIAIAGIVRSLIKNDTIVGIDDRVSCKRQFAGFAGRQAVGIHRTVHHTVLNGIVTCIGIDVIRCQGLAVQIKHQCLILKHKILCNVIEQFDRVTVLSRRNSICQRLITLTVRAFADLRYVVRRNDRTARTVKLHTFRDQRILNTHSKRTAGHVADDQTAVVIGIGAHALETAAADVQSDGDRSLVVLHHNGVRLGERAGAHGEGRGHRVAARVQVHAAPAVAAGVQTFGSDRRAVDQDAVAGPVLGGNVLQNDTGGVPGLDAVLGIARAVYRQILKGDVVAADQDRLVHGSTG